jgi:tripartite ATP-independent transporter DctM subunit
MEYMSLVLFVAVCLVIMIGFPVAFSLAGTSLIVAGIGYLTGTFDVSMLGSIPNRIYGIMTNETLLAVPLFVFMGVMLEKAKIAEELLDTMASLFGPMRGGMGISVVIVGMLLAASTGIVGATVVTMGLLSMPAMINRGYDKGLAAGVICASGTLGQIIPPSIVLVILGDVMSTAFQQAQLKQGIFSPETVSVTDLFLGAIGPGMMLVSLYILYIVGLAIFKPKMVPAMDKADRAEIAAQGMLSNILKVLAPPLLMIVAVLGSILAGVATPTEAASVGAVGAMVLALSKRQLNLSRIKEVSLATLEVTSMVFVIFIGASIFAVVFRGFGGDDMVHDLLTSIPGGTFGAVFAVMAVMFLLGFILDFIEITLVVVPLVGPVLLMMGLDPVWLGIMIALNLQTSFLTPPFGFALFYLRGVAPESVTTGRIYKGVIPFIIIQVFVIFILAMWPELATWLPHKVYG